MSTRSSIYFDGFLPEYKIPERKRRVIDATSGLRRYHLAHPAGVPSRRSMASDEQPVVLFPTTYMVKNTGGLPVPPFLVPAVLEALMNSEQYRRVTQVVPGEADSYCATNARSYGGIILTSDSDLLVHELGHAGSVAFFTDLELIDDSQSGQCSLNVVEYHSQELRSRLSLTDDGDLLALAFELSLDSHLTFKHVLKRAKAGVAKNTFPSEYDKFAAQYRLPGLTQHQDTDGLSGMNLDPRISELVLQAVRPASATKGMGDWTVYLPLLIDCPPRKSAWEASSRVRQVAYGLFHLLEDARVSDVIEVRKLQGVSGGTRIALPPLPFLEEACLDLYQTLSMLRGAVDNQDTRWLLLSVYMDIIDTHEQEKDMSLSVQVFQLQARGILDAASWEFLHLLAQYQGTLYSLRMLLQIMGYVLSKAAQEQPSVLNDLRAELSGLPALDKFPADQELVSLLSHVAETGSLMKMAEHFELPSNASAQIASISSKSEIARQVRDRRRKSKPGRTRTTSNNIFTALADSQE
jgi:hypothetical protein